MDSQATRYTLLLTSLPALPPSFAAAYNPISRIQLDRRLQLLQEQDREQLARIEALTDWGQLGLHDDDAALATAARHGLQEIDSEPLRELVLWRLELRTAVAALRRRARGEAAPGPGPWGVGRWCDHIVRHWGEADLGLGRVFPWLGEASRLLASGDSLALERLLLGAVWDHIGRAADGHHFDFEAVVVYVLRWDISARWAGHDSSIAHKRFDALVQNGLGEYA